VVAPRPDVVVVAPRPDVGAPPVGAADLAGAAALAAGLAGLADLAGFSCACAVHTTNSRADKAPIRYFELGALRILSAIMETFRF